MMRALYTAATGMKAEQTNVDTISHNLSNVNTTGYKTERTEFKSLLYQTIQSKSTTANGDPKPVGAQVGLGTRVAAITSMFTQGAQTASESPTDFCLIGNGFFAVRGIDGNTYYTRNGSFSWALNAQGQTILTTKSGNPVLDTQGNEISVPQGATAETMYFSDTGEIGYKDGDGNVTMLNQSFGIYQFTNPTGLDKMANSLLAVTENSGEPIAEAGANGLTQTKVIQYYIEGSNVNVADEMVNMIIAQRAYELNSKAIQTADSMLDTANNLRR